MGSAQVLAVLVLSLTVAFQSSMRRFEKSRYRDLFGFSAYLLLAAGGIAILLATQAALPAPANPMSASVIGGIVTLVSWTTGIFLIVVIVGPAIIFLWRPYARRMAADFSERRRQRSGDVTEGGAE